MSSNKILVTDSLFIFHEHEQQLADAGYEVVRLKRVKATNDELIHAIKGKVGYILGGIEAVTQPVIDAADQLKCIAFTGSGYKGMIPSWEYATEQGIAIVNTPTGPTQAVAECAIAATLYMNRGFHELDSLGGKEFMTTDGIDGQHVGIIGFGKIGQRLADMIKVFAPATISYFSTNNHDTEGVAFKQLSDLLAESDIIYVCLPDDVGENFIGVHRLGQIKKDALLVSFMHPGIIDPDALYKHLKAGDFRAVSDYPVDKRYKDLPQTRWFSFNGSNAFNTQAALKLTSDMVVQSLLNVLKTGDDQHKVN